MNRSRSTATPATSYTQVGGLFYQLPKAPTPRGSHHFRIPGAPITPEIDGSKTIRSSNLNTPMQSLLVPTNSLSTPKPAVEHSGMLVTYRAKSTLNNPTKIKPFTLSSSKHGSSEERTKKTIDEYHRYKIRRDVERERVKETMLAERELYERAEKAAAVRNRKRWAQEMASSPYCQTQLDDFSRALMVYTPTNRSRSSTPVLQSSKN
ncbi:Hypothetical protein GLP15_2504 [Giardia lamblia P15]|uniref:Uncharacterized protein n=1 Tax=Giardia intestinalis (strain P15) TaxID=658858 RepID=E1EXA0_GIAIA|nr:Hypothetical protein GLP15_2504 [Giardia lamblia P15]